ncbi:MAG TPA: type II secretion system protein N [Burkholderiales bacterium]|nr:type II secretion system protein N [Burkholderiales bacterium]
MRRVRLWGVLLATLAVIVTVAWFAPATWLGNVVAEHSRFRLVYPSGTLWSGSAVLGISDGKTTRVLPGRVAWRVRWKESMYGRLGLAIEHGTVEQAIRVSYDGRMIQLGAGKALWPAAMLEVLGTPFNTISPGGLLRIRWTESRLSSEGFDGTVQVDWDDAQSALSPVAPLGDFRVVVNATGRQGNARLTTLRGPLLLEGQGQMEDGKFQFSGTADAEPEMRSRLNGLIGVLGPRSGQQVLLNWEYRT